ncbi:MAG: glycosyltransferase family 4 protein [Myxococcota bacterium]
MVLTTLTFAYDFPPANHSGMGTHIHELVRGLGAAGRTGHVLVPDSGPVDGLPPSPGVVVHRVPMSAETLSIDRADGSKTGALLRSANHDLLGYAARLVEDGLSVDLLHCHDFYFTPAALELRRTLGVPLVSTVHLAFDPMQRFWGHPIDRTIAALEREMALRSDAVITVSRSMADLLSETHGVPSERLHVVYNGFDPAAFRAADEPLQAIRSRHRLPDGPLVLYAGRVSPMKGVLELVRSARAVVRQRPEVHYLIAGVTPVIDRAYEGEIRAVLADDPLLASRVRFLGRVDRSELAALYRVAALAVVPSAYEPFGYAATEAMASGVPVVASSSGGLAEVVDEGCGARVPWNEDATGARSVDVDALALAQTRLLADPVAAAAMGRRGAAMVAERFSLERMVRGTARVYDAVAS